MLARLRRSSRGDAEPGSYPASLARLALAILLLPPIARATLVRLVLIEDLLIDDGVIPEGGRRAEAEGTAGRAEAHGRRGRLEAYAGDQLLDVGGNGDRRVQQWGAGRRGIRQRHELLRGGDGRPAVRRRVPREHHLPLRLLCRGHRDALDAGLDPEPGFRLDGYKGPRPIGIDPHDRAPGRRHR